jgi:AraC-like DNA-binding protein
MAQVACLSPNHFLRTFKQVFRQTPHQYLIDVRLIKAKQLLTETNRPITDICMAIGFDSLGSFSTLFRRRTGLSPAQYRKQKK